MTTHSPDPFAPGSNIGPYELVREIGRGGMGRVLLARDTSTGDRLVALKVLLADATHRPMLEARFQREIRNLARLRHPGIVTIFSAGSFAGQPFLVMDHLAGRDLREFLFECASLPGAARIERIRTAMAQVARAVAHAHANGIVHRDIKPSNIRIAAGTDEAVLLDFGISKCLDDVGMTGVEMPGTALYMAPEQLDVRLHAGDHLIDVWALGVTLYFALTGELPFKGDTPLALSHDVVYAEPEPPSRLNARISRDLEDVVLGCMRKDAHTRIPSAAEVARLLEELAAPVTGEGAAREQAPVASRRDGTTATPQHGPEGDAGATPARAPEDEPTVLVAATAAWPSPLTKHAPPRRRRDMVARVALALSCLALLTLTREMRVVEASRVQEGALGAADGAGARPARAALAADPRLSAMLAEDDQVARSVLLYTTDIDVRSRRGLMAALRALAEDRPDAALPRLRDFVRDNPKSSLVALARFWIGTVLLASGRAEDANHAYDEIVATSPRSGLAPRALLLQAAASHALGDQQRRDLLLGRLVAEYPSSKAARAAAQPLPFG